MNDMPFTDKTGNVYKYGEYFPPEFSSTAYNETVAHNFYPLTKQEAQEKGFHWYEKPRGQHQPTTKSADLPDHIKEIDDKILKEVIECANEPKGECHGSGVFRMIGAEFEFYKEMGVPIPRFCPDCRHAQRIKQRNPVKLQKRKCMCDHKSYKNKQSHEHGDEPCEKRFETTYLPDSKEIVYCKDCYQKEVG